MTVLGDGVPTDKLIGICFSGVPVACPAGRGHSSWNRAELRPTRLLSSGAGGPQPTSPRRQQQALRALRRAQAALKKPELAVRAAVFLRVGLKLQSDPCRKFNTRIAIGVGRVDFVDAKRVSVSRGPAFALSGEALDAMEGSSLVFVAGDDQHPVLPWLVHGVILLLDCVTGDWTPTVSRAVYGTLRGWTQEKAAERWPVHDKTGKRVTRQAVGDSLARGHWRVVEGVLQWFEQEMLQALELA